MADVSCEMKGISEERLLRFASNICLIGLIKKGLRQSIVHEFFKVLNENQRPNE